MLRPQAGSGDGGGGGYTAQAVHWDGASYLENAALNSGAHDKLSFAVWFLCPAGASICGFWITDPDAPNFSYGEADPDPTPGFGGIQFTLVDVDQDTYLAEVKSSHGDPLVKPDYDTWYVYMGSADCSDSLGKLTGYLNDVDALNPDRSSNGGGPGAVIAGDGVAMRIGLPDPTPRDPVDMANFLMWYGQAIDWSVEANRRFIIDAGGKPVNPALAVAEFGTPTVMFVGDATAFQTNQGTGGTFTLSGSLTNATTSPSD